MGDFKNTNIRVFGKKNPNVTEDFLYWKKLGVPVFLKEFGPIDFIDFSPIEPHYFAVTSSVHVQVYSPVTRLLYKNLSRFQKSAFGGTFRSDGKLICAGGDENVVKLFDVSSKSLLRVFQGHAGPVHRTFFTLDNIHIASFSDDSSVALWDIPSEKQVISFIQHVDYVRAGAVSPICPDILLSGGYDSAIKMFDTRSGATVMSLDHGCPVESVLFLSSGAIFVSAGGTELRVWDSLSGGKLLARLRHNHKTVTCLKLASNGRRFVSGGLDGHVDFYDVASFEKTHQVDCGNAILSLGISANDETLAVGMVDGLVSVMRRETEVAPTKRERRRIMLKHETDSELPAVDMIVKSEGPGRMSKFDSYLKKFEHTKALNAALKPFVVNVTPHATTAVLQELLARHKLHAAVAGGEDKTLLPLLRFLVKYIGEYRFTRVLVDVTNVLMDVYEDEMSELSSPCSQLFMKLSDRLEEETNLTESLLGLEGCLGLFLGAESGAEHPASLPNNLKPSLEAQGFVVNVG